MKKGTNNISSNNGSKKILPIKKSSSMNLSLIIVANILNVSKLQLKSISCEDSYIFLKSPLKMTE